MLLCAIFIISFLSAHSFVHARLHAKIISDMSCPYSVVFISLDPPFCSVRKATAQGQSPGTLTKKNTRAALTVRVCHCFRAVCTYYFGMKPQIINPFHAGFRSAKRNCQPVSKQGISRKTNMWYHKVAWGIGAVGSAPHWQCGGHGFKSRMLH